VGEALPIFHDSPDRQSLPKRFDNFRSTIGAVVIYDQHFERTKIDADL
jgi:hypothetical protein